MLLPFVTGRPVSAVTIEYLEWVSTTLHQEGKTALLMVWDHASWHVSQAVRQWLREHNRAVKQGQKKGIRLVVCRLPSRAPWLNPIEPKWLHGKRAVAEPDVVLEGDALMQRVYAYYGCPTHPLLST